jgi:DNA-binding NarL/FixJ family response regulator
MTNVTTVSVVDHDEEIRRFLSRWVDAAKGFSCLSQYADAQSALRRLPKDAPDIVLLNMHLPDFSGPECLSRLKPLLSETDFVVMTIWEDAEETFQAFEAGAIGCLSKFMERAEFIAALEVVRLGGCLMSSGTARKVIQSFRQKPMGSTVVERLSPRELGVLESLVQGYSCEEIATMFGIGIPTINGHIHGICKKLQVHSRFRAVTRCAGLPMYPKPAQVPVGLG